MTPDPFNLAVGVSTARLQTTRGLPKIRLDRAQRGYATQPAVAAQFSIVVLYNDAPQNYLLVVRAATFGPSGSLPVGSGNLNPVYSGMNISPTVAPLIPGRAALPGQVRYTSSPNTQVYDFFFFNNSLVGSVFGDTPYAVVPPGWSFQLTTSAVNLALTASFLWEALTPDEFVEMYGDYPD